LNTNTTQTKPQNQVSILSPMAASSLHHLDDYKRYGRQMILDGIGLPGALALASIGLYSSMTG
jgi:hypothetical protein